VFVACRRRSDTVIALVFLFAAGWLLGGLFGIWWAVGTLGVLLVFCVWCYRKIGGFTGDTLGAGCEVSEAVPLLMATAGGLMP
jgi:adenosylcobinamide-GDP ribazoletransferase